MHASDALCTKEILAVLRTTDICKYQVSRKVPNFPWYFIYSYLKMSHRGEGQRPYRIQPNKDMQTVHFEKLSQKDLHVNVWITFVGL